MTAGDGLNGAVLDASAVLALINDEPGADVVAACADGALLHPINLAEVLTVVWRDARRAGRDGTDYADSVTYTLTGQGIMLAGYIFTDTDAAYAARLWAEAPELGLSLGDRCCLAVAKGLPGGYALTADTAWANLPEQLNITVHLIRE